MSREKLTLVGSCPGFKTRQGMQDYIKRIAKAAAVAEQHNWSAMLIYSDNRQLDPWISADILLRNSNRISPLIAIQPLYMHPFNLAKTLVSLILVHSRAIHLNFVSGGFPHDLEAFCDTLTHDERYERLGEYVSIVQSLLKRRPYSFEGKYYRLKEMHLSLGLPPDLGEPLLTIAGSSSAGLQVARRVGAVAIQYLRPSDEYSGVEFPPDVRHGARVGIVARQNAAEAWKAAERLYPPDPIGAEIRAYYTTISDSVWVKELARNVAVPPGHPYWLGPYKNGQCACPFLVGSVADVADELARYMRMGLRTFLLEEPENNEDAGWMTKAFRMAENN